VPPFVRPHSSSLLVLNVAIAANSAGRLHGLVRALHSTPLKSTWFFIAVSLLMAFYAVIFSPLLPMMQFISDRSMNFSFFVEKNPIFLPPSLKVWLCLISTSKKLLFVHSQEQVSLPRYCFSCFTVYFLLRFFSQRKN